MVLKNTRQVPEFWLFIASGCWRSERTQVKEKEKEKENEKEKEKEKPNKVLHGTVRSMYCMVLFISTDVTLFFIDNLDEVIPIIFNLE